MTDRTLAETKGVDCQSWLPDDRPGPAGRESHGDNAPRDSYRSTDKVNWSVFVPFLVFILTCGLILAMVMHVCYLNSCYFMGFMPLFTSMILIYPIKLLIRIGECRNTKLACRIGLLLAFQLPLTFYYVGMVNLEGVSPWRIDRLPGHMAARFRTDEWNDFRSSNVVPADRIQRPFAEPNSVGRNIFENSFNLLLELLIVSFVLANVAVGEARRVFVEERRQWAFYDAVGVERGKGTLILAAFHSDSLGSVFFNLQPITVQNQVPIANS